MSNNVVSRRLRKTRIIATLGPSTSDSDTITRLLQAGVNVIRLNMSHGNHAEHQENFQKVRKIARRLKLNVAIFCDLCGPKIRVGLLEGGSVELKPRSEIILTTRVSRGKGLLIPCQYKSLHKDVNAGERILLDDGKMELKVIEVVKKDIHCRVVYGGILKNNKGINLPDSNVSSSSLTPSDKQDVVFAQKLGADFIALSFVRTGKDIERLNRFMQRHGDVLPVIAKIEKPEALDNIDDILRQSYAIMIARGDLGIEIDAARVPMAQKDLINRARRVCKPVIVATQMMESMITESRPTRAEVGDVSNAALNGADAVMLSGETSVGKYPIQAVKYMRHILSEMEGWQLKNPNSMRQVDMNITKSPRRALANAAVSITQDLGLLGLFVPTSSGATAGVVSAYRPLSPIYGICKDDKTARKLMLHWGVIPFVMPDQETADWEKMIRTLTQRYKIKIRQHSAAVLSGFGKESENNQPVLKILRF